MGSGNQEESMKKIKFLVLAAITLLYCSSVTASYTITASQDAALPWHRNKIYLNPNVNDGYFVSIKHHPINGKAYVSYYDTYNKDLKLAYQVSPGLGNCGPNASWRCRTVDSDGDVGKYTSIDVAYVENPSFPALSYTKVGISYYDESNKALKYALYRSDSPTIGVQSVDVAINSSVSSLGKFSSLKFEPETHSPVISYYAHNWYDQYVGYSALKLATYVGSGGTGCNNSTGGKWTCEEIDRLTGAHEGNNKNGSHSSLDFNYLGNLYIAFHDSYTDELQYAVHVGSGGSCSNPAWNCVLVDGGGALSAATGYSISMHAKKSSMDRMRIAYWMPGAGYLRYAVSRLSGTDGNCDNGAFDCITVDEVHMPVDSWESEDSFGYSEISLAMDANNAPMITYSNGYSLKLARPASAYGLAWGNCGDPWPGGDHPYFQCTILHSALDSDGVLGQFNSLSVSPSGLPMVAYSEDIFSPVEQFLWVTYKVYESYLPLIKR